MRKRIAVVIAAVGLLVLNSGTGQANAGGGCHGDIEAKFSDADTTDVRASQCSFQPTVARVDAGEEVTFQNKDAAPHTFTGVLSSWGNYEGYGEGESVSYSFDKPGVYPYFCELHPGMAGAIVVGDGSAAADATSGSGVSAVSAVTGGQPSAPEADGGSATTDGSGSTAAIVAVVAMLGAVLGLAALGPAAVRRIRARA